MYEIGKVYIWQNLREHVHLNGTETTVVGTQEFLHGRRFENNFDSTFVAWETDTLLDDGRILFAGPEHLRPKYPPSGEQSVYDLLNRVRECETQ